MKIESIKEPRQLDDGTVKASITVSDEDFIPLIQLIKDVKKGAEIDIDVRKSDNDPNHDSIWEFAQRQARELDSRLRVEFERGKEFAVKSHEYLAPVDDFPASQVEKHEEHIKGEHQGEMTTLEGSCKR